MDFGIKKRRRHKKKKKKKKMQTRSQLKIPDIFEQAETK